MNAAAPDGETIAYWSYQPFGDPHTGLPSSYKSVRTAAGWATRQWSPAPPPTDVTPWIGDKVLIGDATDDLFIGFFQSALRFDPLLRRPNTPIFVTNPADVFSVDSSDTVKWESRGNGSDVATAPVISTYVGRSADGSHVLFETTEQLVDEARDQLGGTSLYVRANGHTRLVAAEDGGRPVSACGASVRDYRRNDVVGRGAISVDGSRVVFSAPDPAGWFASGDPSCLEPIQIYVRDGDTVVHVSRTQRSVPDDPAESRYPDASADGSKIFFISDEALTDDADPASSAMLYEFDTPTRTLKLVDAGGNVVTIAGVSDDGSRVYYVRGTQLMLYADGVGRPIAQLSADEVNADWLNWPAPVRITSDGRHIVFLSRANLTSFDAHGAAELFRYSEVNDSLMCISCSATGTPPLGDAALWSTSDIKSVHRSPGLEIWLRTVVVWCLRVAMLLFHRMLTTRPMCISGKMAPSHC